MSPTIRIPERDVRLFAAVQFDAATLRELGHSDETIREVAQLALWFGDVELPRRTRSALAGLRRAARLVRSWLRGSP